MKHVRLFVAGDTHGNIRWLTNYLYPTAVAVGADKILIVGDFGYWEHTKDGVEFLNACDVLAATSNVPLYWLHGNHDNWTLAMRRYGEQRDAEGFVRCRNNVLYVPQGHSWSWGSRHLRSFGGAYSIDKKYRLEMEQRRYERLVREEGYRAAKKHVKTRPVPSQANTLWFEDEQMSDEEMFDLLERDSDTKDVVFSHDKPAASRPGWNRKDIAECLPNQKRLDAAMRVHEPRYWIHGHLHYSYADVQGETIIVGLEPDNAAAEVNWRRENTWLLLDLSPEAVDMRYGAAMNVDPAVMRAARNKLPD